MNSPTHGGFAAIALSVAACLSAVAHGADRATPDLIVSANDAKYVRVVGQETYPEGTGPDTLTLLDAASSPMKVLATVDVHHTLVGPPDAVAITPNGALAIVSAPNYYDRATHKSVTENYLQVVDLTSTPARMIDKVDLGVHPQGIAINREGTLLLAATAAGTVAVLDIAGSKVTLRDQLKISDKRLSGISFTHDGKAALVALRDEQGLVVLDVDGNHVTATRDRISTGVAPYTIDVSGDGKWAVVSNVGLGGLVNPGHIVGDADSVTLIDVSKRPFRAVQHLTVPATPEGVAISPNGRWIAVQSMDGSSLLADNPGRKLHGQVVLFEIEEGHAVERNRVPGGEAAQGIVFTTDSSKVLVQFNVEKQLAVYEVSGGKLRDTGTRIPVAGGPASIRSTPR